MTDGKPFESIVPDDAVPSSEADISKIDTSVAHSARIYDYWLGGKDNFAADREAGELVIASRPGLRESVRANRAFLGRVVRLLAGELGIRQFLDVGTGIPSANNTHEVAQQVATDARIVYTDNDPIVLAHGRALLADNASTIVVTADLRDPNTIMTTPEITGFLDFTKPVALILNAVVHHVLDEEDPYLIVGRYKELLASGSYLLLTHFSNYSGAAHGLEDVLLRALGRGQLRNREEITRFFDGFDLVPPGVVHLVEWHPDEPQSLPLGISELLYLGGLARKP